jgi:hypothetical protein
MLDLIYPFIHDMYPTSFWSFEAHHFFIAHAPLLSSPLVFIISHSVYVDLELGIVIQRA